MRFNKDTYGRWVGILVLAPVMWRAADTGDTTPLKPLAVGLVAWELLWVTGILEHDIQLSK